MMGSADEYSIGCAGDASAIRNGRFTSMPVVRYA